MKRREFIHAAVAFGASPIWAADTDRDLSGSRVKAGTVLETFDYQGVRLLPSFWSRQLESTRELYFGLTEDDVLHGFREAAGLPAPGKNLTGWCSRDSSVVFGQWLSGMARMSRALGDDALRNKAVALAEGWASTAGKDNYRLGTYTYDKTVCGLLDLALYAGYADAWRYLEQMTEWASRALDRARSPATPLDRDGRKPHGTNEWYTLPENLYRAYIASGNRLYKDFGDVWLYSTFWDEFLHSANPPRARYLHAYSHCNTFSSAAMAYAVTGRAEYLQILKNGYDWMRHTQCFASGGYGPGEWTVAGNGDLGDSLDFRSDGAEIPCGSWGAFKHSKYLLRFTGDARYGDWIECLLYNGIGAALPVRPGGDTFYYADYRIGMAQKEYYWDHWPCCSGTYIQAVADYHDVIYFRDGKGLFVNLYVPSEVTWKVNGDPVTVRQETSFPETDSSVVRFTVERPMHLAVRFRVPEWTSGFGISVNDQPAQIQMRPGSRWAIVERTWVAGDRMTIHLPMSLRLQSVDAQHPHRAAVMYGPVLLAQDARYTMALVVPGGEDISQLLEREGPGLRFGTTRPSGREQKIGSFSPFYEIPQDVPYRVYFDTEKLRFL